MVAATLASEHAPELREHEQQRLASRDGLIDPLIGWTITLAIASGALVAATAFVNGALLDGGIESIDARIEQSVWTWAASSAALAGALACMVHAIASVEARRRWLGLGLMLAYFSLDDWYQVHEKLSHGIRLLLGLSQPFGPIWLVAYVPLLVLTFRAVALIAGESSEPVRRALVAGLWLLAAGVALEAIGVPIEQFVDPHAQWPDAAREILEEATELAGLVAIAGGLVTAQSVAIQRTAQPRARITDAR